MPRYQFMVEFEVTWEADMYENDPRRKRPKTKPVILEWIQSEQTAINALANSLHITNVHYDLQSLPKSQWTMNAPSRVALGHFIFALRQLARKTEWSDVRITTTISNVKQEKRKA